MQHGSDILIIGGGVVGLTTAFRLAGQGVSVTVVDRQRVGSEASWAGAGMLPPGNSVTAATPDARLRSWSYDMWDTFSAELRELSGIDNGYRKCGAVEVGTDDATVESQIKQWQTEGLDCDTLDRGMLERYVPGLHPQFQRGAFLPEFAQVRNPRHLKALTAACQSLGVEILECVDCLSICAKGSAVEVTSPSRHFGADRVCLTAGSWTGQLMKSLGVGLPVSPVRGQIAQLRVNQLPFSCVIEQGRRYMVPRADGLILVGSTEEHAGFEKRNTSEGISGLLAFAQSIVPELRSAEVVRCWAGLRPGSPDELPFLGPVPGYDNVFVGAGHYRSGLQMSPATATVLADLMLGRAPAISLDGLDLTRTTRPSAV
ncbi:MAG: glycine oxidase ThiO [Fuerstiella sp.]|nr:glycine oxidase ThiO [Fuerstiella sp.]